MAAGEIRIHASRLNTVACSIGVSDFFWLSLAELPETISPRMHANILVACSICADVSRALFPKLRFALEA